MPILAWVLLGVFSTVVLTSLLAFAIGEAKRIHDDRFSDSEDEP